MPGKVIGLGITGSIAAYKAVEIARRLIDSSFDVHAVLTHSGAQFITPLTLRTITRNPVTVDMFEDPVVWDVKHISLAKRCDAFLIAPATANVIGKIANGIADDMLSTTLMALSCPVVIAPAMNSRMYENPFVQANIQRLRDHGYVFVEPEEGLLACGDTGKGRLASVDEIVEAVVHTMFSPKDLAGWNVLITAGPTQEAIDPVRFITNHSSGRMGYAIAEAASLRGAQVTLVSGPTDLPVPRGVDLIRVTSAKDMLEQVSSCFSKCDALIMAAAVADYTPAQTRTQKMKKDPGAMTMQLDRTTDILKEMGSRKEHQVVVGFAAETDNIVMYAKGKLAEKNADLIVANDITRPGAGFRTTTNIASIITKEKVEHLPQMSKLELGHVILDMVKECKGG